jgi:cell wall-associated NlpC family hydrolase
VRTSASVRRLRARHLPVLLSVLLVTLVTLVTLPLAVLSPTSGGARPAAAAQSATSAPGHQVVAEAARHQGKPYRWGASGPNAFDCSGFTLFVFSRFGRSLPHSSRAQYAVARAVPQGDRRVGDLIFSYGRSGRIHHVGIYAGGDTIWHAPRRGDVVRRSSLWSTRYRVGRLG